VKLDTVSSECCLPFYSDCCVDNEVRARGVQLLLAVCGSDRNHQVIGKLVDALMLKDSTASSRKTRYFGDSQHHRMKHRVMQSILLVEPLLDVVSVLLVTVVKLNFQSLQLLYVYKYVSV